MGLLSEGASPECAAVQKVIRAGQICQTLQATLQTRIDALTTAATAVGKANDLAVCEDKARRLPDFLAQQYGLLAKGKFPKLSDEPGSEFAVENQLIITHARYGDIFNEDRDYRRDEGKKSVRYLPRREPTTPRADMVFTDPEDYADILDERGWERHRHTCDLTHYFRRECRPKPWTKEDASWAGSTYCHIRDTGLKDLCGYDRSPQGIKQFHIQYSCNELDAKNQSWTTRYLRELKSPGQTSRINIICELPETGLRDMQWEVTYFTTDPCKISMPALAAAGSPADNKAPEQAPKNPAQPQPAPGAPPKKQ